MRLSAPIYMLKRKAKLYAREAKIALNKALDTVAIDEGYLSWSHLASSHAALSPARRVLAQLAGGDLCVIGARPGQGKTLLGLELVSMASNIGRTGYFFTLEYHARDVEVQLAGIGVVPGGDALVVDTSDDVSAGYIIDRLKSVTEPTLIVVDYLQLLDQKRSNPDLDMQMEALRTYVTGSNAICAVLSQIDRSFDLGGRSMPEVSDVRLPNPVDLSVFNKACFLHEGKIRLDRAA